jgi:hypothetical protein
MDKDIMTDEEGEYWDDYFTKNPPKVDPAKNRILSGEGPVARMTRHASNGIVDNLGSDVIQNAAIGETQCQVNNANIRRELTLSA